MAGSSKKNYKVALLLCFQASKLKLYIFRLFEANVQSASSAMTA